MSGSTGQVAARGTSNSLLNEIRSELGKFSVNHLYPSTVKLRFGQDNRSTADADVIYEAFLYFRVARAIRGVDPGSTVVSSDSDFHFRCKNGELRTTPANCSFILFAVKQAQFELHVDTYVETRVKGTRVEVDFGIFSRFAANRCRSGQTRMPDFRSLRIFGEAKDFADSVTSTVARGFVGSWHLLGRRKKTKAFFITATECDANGRKLVNGVECECYDRLLPVGKAGNDRVSRWEARVRSILRKLR